MYEDKLQWREGKAWDSWSCFKVWREKEFQLTRKSLVLRHKVWTTSVRSALLGSSLREKADTTTLNCTWGPRQGTWQTWHIPLLRAQWSSIFLNFFCCLLSSNTRCWVAKLRPQFSICRIPHLAYSIHCYLPWVIQVETVWKRHLEHKAPQILNHLWRKGEMWQLWV